MKHPILNLYMYFYRTLASLRNRIAATRILFEALLSSLDNFVKRANINLPKFSLEMSVDNTVQLAQDLPQLGIEVVFDAVVSPS